MKRVFLWTTTIAFVLFLGGCASGWHAQNGQEHVVRVDAIKVMTLEEIIALNKAGVSDSLLVSMLRATDYWYELTSKEVIDLKNAGISEKIIHAMVTPKKSFPQSEEWYRTNNCWYWYNNFNPYWWGYWPHRSVYIAPPRIVIRGHGMWIPRLHRRP